MVNDKGQACAKVKITPEMISAGADAFAAYSDSFADCVLLVEVYTAMRLVEALQTESKAECD